MCYEKDWEMEQFNRNGDARHASTVTAKYGGIKFLDEDLKKDGAFSKHKHAVMVKCSKKNTKAKRIVGKRYINDTL